MKIHFFPALLLCAALCGVAPRQAESATLPELRRQAREWSSLGSVDASAEQRRLRRQQEIATAWNPSLRLDAQASYQSDVFALPFSLPSAPSVEIPHFQYRAELGISQTLSDAGTGEVRTQLEAVAAEQTMLQNSVEKHKLDEVVTSLYFAYWMADKRRKIAVESLEALRVRLQVVSAAVQAGGRTPADRARLEAEIASLQREQASAENAQQAALRQLAMITGQPAPVLTEPSGTATTPAAEPRRPELELYSAAERRSTLQADLAATARGVRTSLFARLGAGSPNPFNMFETGLSPYWVAGIQMQWSPFDWGAADRSREAAEAERAIAAHQSKHLRQAIERAAQKIADDVEAARRDAALAADLVEARRAVLASADAAMRNGTITVAEWHTEFAALQRARLSLETAELEQVRQQELYILTLGLHD